MTIKQVCLGFVFGLFWLGFAHAQERIYANGFEPPNDFPANDSEAVRFLLQASFGPTAAEITRLRNIGYSAWLEAEFAKPASRQELYLDFVAGIPEPVYQNARMEAWYQNALLGNDQLRQRIAYAYSQIFVTSDFSAGLENEVYGMAIYYDMLAQNAFGNYRDLLENVTLSPIMGQYLSMRGNRKPDLALNIRPDENFAREILQLFSIGLVMLNPDGSVITNAGQPVPTYNNSVIKAFAHVFTGWNYGTCTGFEFCGAGFPVAIGARVPMRAFADFHHVEPDADPLNNTLLQNVQRPSGGTPEANLDFALDNIFNHPNVGPFIARRLIQNLVSSNPSPQYLSRISSVFNNNGQGQRGDMRAVIKAILLDPEARNISGNRGKLREPIMREVATIRAFNGRAAINRFQLWNPEQYFGQAPGRSPSVFNFFLPDYKLPGEITALGLFSPEFQITTETTITLTSNRLKQLSEHAFWDGAPSFIIKLDLSALAAAAGNPATLLDQLNVLLMYGQMSTTMRSTLINYLTTIPFTAPNDTGGKRRAIEALDLILVSPEYSVLK